MDYQPSATQLIITSFANGAGHPANLPNLVRCRVSVRRGGLPRHGVFSRPLADPAAAGHTQSGMVMLVTTSGTVTRSPPRSTSNQFPRRGPMPSAARHKIVFAATRIC